MTGMDTTTAERVTFFDGTDHAVTFEVGELVTVHDPCGDMPGQIETVTPSHLYIVGPSLGPTDSRSWHWSVSMYVVGERVSKLDHLADVERARGGDDQ